MYGLPPVGTTTSGCDDEIMSNRTNEWLVRHYGNGVRVFQKVKSESYCAGAHHTQ